MKKIGRKLFWKFCLNPYLSKKLNGSPLLGYSMFIWLEFEGKEVYLINGYKAFQKVWENKLMDLNQVFKNLINDITTPQPPPPEIGSPEWFEVFEKWSNALEEQKEKERQEQIDQCEQILKENGYE